MSRIETLRQSVHARELREQQQDLLLQELRQMVGSLVVEIAQLKQRLEPPPLTWQQQAHLAWGQQIHAAYHDPDRRAAAAAAMGWKL